MALDETLRLYPPAWIGPRRAVAHVRVRRPPRPRRRARELLLVGVSHRLPDVFAEPDAFRPERFAPERARRAPKGAYVPFGGGSRICIGMRFGQTEIKRDRRARSCSASRLELAPGHRLTIRQTPTLGPARRAADARRGVMR